MAEIITYVQSKSSAPPPFSPTDIAGLQLWLKADAGVTLNGSTVSQWDDQSGNGNNAVQNTAANQPIFVANTLNGKPSLRFDGSNDFMTAPFIYTLKPLTCFIVFKLLDNSFRTIISNTNQSFIPNNQSVWYIQNEGFRFYDGTGIMYVYVPSGNYYTFTSILNGSTSDAYRNGVRMLGAPTTTGTNTATNLYIGLGVQNFSSNFNSDIVEIVIYASALSINQRQQVEFYLQQKYLHY